jgi:hypothetical protein
LRRCRNGELRVDEYGCLQDPHVRVRLLRDAIAWIGSPIHDAAFGCFLSSAIDLQEIERQRMRRHIFLARYGKQSMLQWEGIEGRLVRKYVEALSDFLEEESEISKRAAAES